MSFLKDVDLLFHVVARLQLKDIFSLLQLNNEIKLCVIKHYEQHQINLFDMPIFNKCNDILLYLQHYNSFMMGKSFPDQPLWLFKNVTDDKFIYKNDKYQKVKTLRDKTSKYENNYNKDYRCLNFVDAYHHWNHLDEKQKYIVWCALTGTHPEIRLNIILNELYDNNCGALQKMMFTGKSEEQKNYKHAHVIISEAYWYYPHTFSRYYLDVFLAGNNTL